MKILFKISSMFNVLDLFEDIADYINLWKVAEK